MSLSKNLSTRKIPHEVNVFSFYFKESYVKYLLWAHFVTVKQSPKLANSMVMSFERKEKCADELALGGE